jgi:hypothetical protein
MVTGYGPDIAPEMTLLYFSKAIVRTSILEEEKEFDSQGSCLESKPAMPQVGIKK